MVLLCYSDTNHNTRSRHEGTMGRQCIVSYSTLSPSFTGTDTGTARTLYWLKRIEAGGR